uniref:Uncharacterized protein n=1 Tax=Labrus bergylta TaxID=56723 RepID=A0A3Q3LIQ6_9LABR
MASGDDDDPIIEEVDVYLAKSLADKLYLFQYPVRPSTMTYDDVNHLAARIKPKQQRVNNSYLFLNENDGQTDLFLHSGHHQHVQICRRCFPQRSELRSVT